MSQDKGEGYVTIPRLAEYYRGGRVVGWGDAIPEAFQPHSVGGQKSTSGMSVSSKNLQSRAPAE
jgi:hypothetical protein